MKKRTVIIGVGVLVVLVVGTAVFFNKQRQAEPAQGAAPVKRARIDLSSPENTLASYFSALRLGDEDGVNRCFGGRGFELRKPLPVKDFAVTKEYIYTQAKVDELITQDEMPDPRYYAEDVELEVREIFGAGESGGPEPYRDGQEEMYTYVLRQVHGYWIIVAHCAWDQY